MASGSGNDQDAHVHGHGQRAESHSGATTSSSSRAPSAAAAAAEADVSLPLPPPAALLERPQERARGGGGGGGADESNSAASRVDRKGKKVVTFADPLASYTPASSNGSSGLPAFHGSDYDAEYPGAGGSSFAAGGEMYAWYQREMEEMLRMAQEIGHDGAMGRSELDETAPEEEEKQDEKQKKPPQAKVIHWLVKRKKPAFGKVKYYIKNKFLGRKRRQPYLSNQNSKEYRSPKRTASTNVDDQIHPIVEVITHYWDIENSKSDDLRCAYSGFRTVEGDGECFYRSFIFSYLEQVLDRQDTYEEQRLLDAVKTVAREHANLGWTSDNFSRSRIAFEELIEEVKGWKSSNNQTSAGSLRKQNLHLFFNTPSRANAIFEFLRSVIAIWICSRRHIYEHYINWRGKYRSLGQWCRLHLVARRDTDHVLMSALAGALKVRINVVHIQDAPDQQMYNNEEGVDGISLVTVILLFSPGHYDILYPRPRPRRPAECSSAQAESSSGQAESSSGQRPDDQSSSQQSKQEES